MNHFPQMAQEFDRVVESMASVSRAINALSSVPPHDGDVAKARTILQETYIVRRKAISEAIANYRARVEEWTEQTLLETDTLADFGVSRARPPVPAPAPVSPVANDPTGGAK